MNILNIMLSKMEGGIREYDIFVNLRIILIVME
jgi:hypothetical protein